VVVPFSLKGEGYGNVSRFLKGLDLLYSLSPGGCG